MVSIMISLFLLFPIWLSLPISGHQCWFLQYRYSILSIIFHLFVFFIITFLSLFDFLYLFQWNISSSSLCSRRMSLIKSLYHCVKFRNNRCFIIKLLLYSCNPPATTTLMLCYLLYYWFRNIVSLLSYVLISWPELSPGHEGYFKSHVCHRSPFIPNQIERTTPQSRLNFEHIIR